MYKLFLLFSLAILSGCGTNSKPVPSKNAPIFVRPEPNNATKVEKVPSNNEPKVLSGSGKNTKYFIVSESDLRLIAQNTNQDALNKLLEPKTNEIPLNINENKQKANDSEPNKPTVIPLQLIEIPAEPQKKQDAPSYFNSILITLLLFLAAFGTLFYFYKRNNQK